MAVVALTTSATSIFAQKYNSDALLAKVQKSDEAIANPKKAEKASTWISRGELFNSIAAANTNSIFAGMTEDLLIEAVGKPVNADNITGEKFNGVNYKKFQYQGIDIYLTEDTSEIAFWLITKHVIDDATAKAIEAYDKAFALDAKTIDDVTIGYATAANFIINEGQNNYDTGNYLKASELFEEGAKIDANNPKGATLDVDNINYFATVSATQAEAYDRAGRLIEALINKGVEKDGDVYYYAGIIFDGSGDNAKAEQYLRTGIEKYLENARVLQQFIYFALKNQLSPDEILPYITKAQEKEPNNVSYILAEASIYDTAKNFEKSIETYNRALTVDPNNFNALYNLGFAYRLKAVSINEQLKTIDYTNTKVIDELTAQFKGAMLDATVPLKKANEVNPKNTNVVEILKSIYFTLRDDNATMLEEYNKYNDLLKTM